MDTSTALSEKRKILTALEIEVARLQDLLSSLDDSKVNKIPFAESWTAGQVLRHVTKSTDLMAKAMASECKPAERAADEKTAVLKQTLLDFSQKMKSPEFIVPEAGPFEKQLLLKDLSRSLLQLNENAMKADLHDLVKDLPTGEITKLELLHFVLYHTQRHLHQLRNICEAL